MTVTPSFSQAASAAGARVAGWVVARDAILEIAPIESGAALASLSVLAALWRANLDRPLPVACRAALAELQGGDARETYDGGYEINGEVTDACLARLWPEFARLRADASAAGGWRAIAEQLYGPLVAWLREGVTVTRHDAEGDAGAAEAAA